MYVNYSKCVSAEINEERQSLIGYQGVYELSLVIVLNISLSSRITKPRIKRTGLTDIVIFIEESIDSKISL